MSFSRGIYWQFSVKSYAQLTQASVSSRQFRNSAQATGTHEAFVSRRVSLSLRSVHSPAACPDTVWSPNGKFLAFQDALGAIRFWSPFQLNLSVTVARKGVLSPKSILFSKRWSSAGRRFFGRRESLRCRRAARRRTAREGVKSRPISCPARLGAPTLALR
jgi:hypothetical protein